MANIAKIHAFISRLILCGAVFALTVSCAPLPEYREGPGEYVWPLPPEKARIRYVRSIFGEDDIILKQSKVDLFIGKNPSTDLIKPYGVTTDRAGRIYVADTVRKAIFIFDELMSTVDFITLNGGFRIPVCVAVDDRERIYVSDTGHDEVFMIDRSGRLIRRFGRGLLNNPSGMAIDNMRNRIYVVSTKSHRVEVFTLEGEHLFGFGKRGGGPGMMNFPRDIEVDYSGDLYVVDSGNFRVQVFNGNGSHIRSFGEAGSFPGQFSRPKGIGIDVNGNIYVVDSAFNNFQVFTPQGKLLLFVGSAGNGPGEFSLPSDIHVDERNRVYVVDQLNGRVQIFQILE